MSESERLEIQPHLRAPDRPANRSWNAPPGSAFFLGRDPRTLSLGPGFQDTSEEDVVLKISSILTRDRRDHLRKPGHSSGRSGGSNRCIWSNGTCYAPRRRLPLLRLLRWSLLYWTAVFWLHAKMMHGRAIGGIEKALWLLQSVTAFSTREKSEEGSEWI